MTVGHSSCNPYAEEVNEARAPTGGRFQPAEVRRRQILDALARLAVSEGLDTVTIARVAAEAGIAKGSIYLHYGSRAELIAALQADVWERMLADPSAVAVEQSMTWTQRLDRILEHWIAFEFDNHDLYHAVFHVAGTGGPEPMEQARLLLRSVLDGGSRAGEFHVVDLDTTTEFLLHGYGGPCYHSTDRAHVAMTLRALFHRAIGVSEGAPEHP